ncbi:FeoA family protein [Rhodobacter ferrooxidans]|uniref:FeoA family protein n=1 Tax=Rhodobacter ferrooxidans TaxID=371731 RepID=C8S543_9RHOB|nr:FeoA family protein [Rhodobacter sp. SW2]EEW23908.1 FeoA family protein [Rhodobacter sp. SW2]
MALKFSDIPLGGLVRVAGYAPGGQAYRQKLLSMGLTPGTRLRLVNIAPLGDPIMIELRGFRLSLRKAEAEALEIEGCAE